MHTGTKGAPITNSTILIAKFLGPIMLVSSISMFLNRDLIMSIFEDFVKSPSLLFIAGMMALTMGIAIVTFHNIWVAGWPVFITIVGWMAIPGGILRMAFPAFAIKVGRQMMDNQRLIPVIGVVNILIGGFLTYMAYLA